MSINKHYKTNNQDNNINKNEFHGKNSAMLDIIIKLFCERDINSIWIDGYKNIQVDTCGKLEKVSNLFDSDDEIIKFIKKLAKLTNQTIDEENYIIEGDLSSNLMFMAVLPLNYQTSPVLVIKRNYIDYLQSSIIDQKVEDYFNKIIKTKKNILICSEPKGGKTTVLNLLLNKIKKEERCIVIENTYSENMLRTDFMKINITPFYENDKIINFSGLNKKFINHIQNLRPDRIILDEADGGDILDFLKITDLYFRGSIFTINASGYMEAIEKIEKMIKYKNNQISNQKLISLLSYAIDVIIQVENVDGFLQIKGILELDIPLENQYDINSIFKFDGKDYNLVSKPDYSNIKQKVRGKKFNQAYDLKQIDSGNKLKKLGRKIKRSIEYEKRLNSFEKG